MNKAIFLDRDGVINRKGGSYYICYREEFIFNEGVMEMLGRLADAGFLLIVITNQGCISKGVCSDEEVRSLHLKMTDEFKENGINITAVYFCPHHPDNEACSCRKPGSLLFERAIEDFNIDRKLSCMIGDSDIDIEAARGAGVRGIKVPTNCDLRAVDEINSLLLE